MSKKESTPLNCPCGGRATVDSCFINFFVFCKKCGSSVVEVGSRERAVKSWNEQVSEALKNGYNYLWDYNEGHSDKPITECPCGGKSLFLARDEEGDVEGDYYVICTKCNRQGGFEFKDRKAISSWEKMLEKEYREDISQKVDSQEPQKLTKTIISKSDSPKNELNLCSCGCIPRINETESGYKVICQTCGKPGKRVKSKEVAISKWNDANS